MKKKLSEYEQAYHEFSGKASDVARQLAFAGIALIWIFNYKDQVKIKIPEELILPAVLFAFTLLFDLLQYISSTIIWGWFWRYNEKKFSGKKNDPDLDAPPYFNWPAHFFFWGKLFLVLCAYAFLIYYLVKLWFN